MSTTLLKDSMSATTSSSAAAPKGAAKIVANPLDNILAGIKKVTLPPTIEHLPAKLDLEKTDVIRIYYATETNNSKACAEDLFFNLLEVREYHRQRRNHVRELVTKRWLEKEGVKKGYAAREVEPLLQAPSTADESATPPWDSNSAAFLRMQIARPQRLTEEVFDEWRRLEQENKKVLAIMFVATAGKGDFPFPSVGFWNSFKRPSVLSLQKPLQNVEFCLFGLGNSNYAEFNYASRRLYSAMQRLGAVPLIPLVCGDEVDDFGTEQELDPWLEKLSREVFGIGPYEERLTLAYEDERTDYKGFEDGNDNVPGSIASGNGSGGAGSSLSSGSRSSPTASPSLRIATKRKSLDATIDQLSSAQVDDLRGRKKAVQGQRYAVHQLSRGSADAWRLIAKSLKRYDVVVIPSKSKEAEKLDWQLRARSGVSEKEKTSPLYVEEKGRGFRTELMRNMDPVDDFRAPTAKEAAEVQKIFRQNVIRGPLAERPEPSSSNGDEEDAGGAVTAVAGTSKKVNLVFPRNLPKLQSLENTELSRAAATAAPTAFPPSGDPHFSDSSVVQDARWMTKSPQYEDQVLTVTVRHTEPSKWGAGDILSMYPVMAKANVDEVLDFFGCHGDQWVKIRKAGSGDKPTKSGAGKFNEVPASECLVEALKWREREWRDRLQNGKANSDGHLHENTTITSEDGWICIRLDELMSTYVDVSPRPTSRYIYRILASLVVGDETNAHIGEIKFFLQKEVDLHVVRARISGESVKLNSPEFPLVHLCSRLGVLGSDLLFDQVKYMRLDQGKIDEIHAVVETKKEDLRRKAAEGDGANDGEKARKSDSNIPILGNKSEATKQAEAAEGTLKSLAEAVEKEQFLAKIQMEKLLIFASGTLEGKSELYNYVKKTQRSLFDVIRDFARAQADFELLFNCVFPLILPREYSIASGNMRHAKSGVGRISDDRPQNEKHTKLLMSGNADDVDDGETRGAGVENEKDNTASLVGALVKTVKTAVKKIVDTVSGNASATPENYDDLALSSSLSFPASTPPAVVMMTMNPLLHSHTWYSQLVHNSNNRNNNNNSSTNSSNSIDSLLSEISSECLPQVCVSVLDTHEAYRSNKSRIKPLPRRGLCSNYIAGLGDSPLALVRCGLKVSKTVAGPVRDGYEWDDLEDSGKLKDSQQLDMAPLPAKRNPRRSRRNPGVIIYVSTGTGISPVRALIQERGRLLVGSGGSGSEDSDGEFSPSENDMQLNVNDVCMEHSTHVNPDVLFVGHRFRNEDFLFGEEWQQLDVFSGEETATFRGGASSSLAEKKEAIIKSTQTGSGKADRDKSPKPSDRDKKLLRMDPYRKKSDQKLKTGSAVTATSLSSAPSVSVHGAFSRDDQDLGKFYVQHAVESMPSKQKMRKLLIESKSVSIVIAGRSESMPDAVERAFVKVLTGDNEDDEEDFAKLAATGKSGNASTTSSIGDGGGQDWQDSDEEPVNPGCLSTVAAKKLLSRMRQEGRYVIDTWG